MPLDPQKLRAEQIASELSTYDERQLASIIELANRQYWDEDNPSLPDPLYDQLVERLRELAPDHALLEDMGPKVTGISQDAATLAKLDPQERFGSAVRHRVPMLSLEKCYEPQELQEWVQKRGTKVLVMPKMDGVAASLLYSPEGRLAVAATRGSGKVGEDITLRIQELSSVPNPLSPAPGLWVEIRGEVYMRRSVFEAHYAKEFSHPRNLTAGSLKRKDASNGARGSHLRFYAYDIDGLDHEDESQKLRALAGFGFESPDARVIEQDEVIASVQAHTKARPTLDYEIDGIVYRVADVATYQALGATGHHPRGAIAFKFQGQSAQSRLGDVEWSVSRTGAITPVAIFDEVLVDGARLTRASLHNLQRFESMKLGKNATLEITRRGGVIPMVQCAIDHGDLTAPYRAPSECPACGGSVERVKRREGEFLFCSSIETCSVARLRELEHFAKVTDMMGFGPKLLELAFEADLLSDIEDYFTLSANGLTNLERVGEKTANNLLAQVENAKQLDLAVFLQSLGIAHLGQQNAQRLAQAFVSMSGVRQASQAAIEELPGFQETMATAILDGLAARGPLIDRLLTHIEVKDAEPLPSPESTAEHACAISGLTVLFTGTLTTMSRSEAQACLAKVGATAAKSVNRKLDLLVLGQGKGGMSSKEKKARALVDEGASIEIIDENEFWTRMPAQLAPEHQSLDNTTPQAKD